MSKPVECTIPRVDPKVNYGLEVTILCQCRFIDCDKCNTPVWDVGNGEVVWGVGQELYGNSGLFLLNFAVNRIVF